MSGSSPYKQGRSKHRRYTLFSENIYLSYYDVELTEGDVEGIRKGWLAENVIAFFEEYLVREKLSAYPGARISLLRPKVASMLTRLRYDHSLGDNLNFRQATHIFLPIKTRYYPEYCHWSLLLISQIDSLAFHYDSFNALNNEKARAATENVSTLLEKPLNFSNIRSPQQTQQSDSGVFVCHWMDHLLLNRLLMVGAETKISVGLQNETFAAAQHRQQMINIIEGLRHQAKRVCDLNSEARVDHIAPNNPFAFHSSPLKDKQPMKSASPESRGHMVSPDEIILPFKEKQSNAESKSYVKQNRGQNTPENGSLGWNGGKPTTGNSSDDAPVHSRGHSTLYGSVDPDSFTIKCCGYEINDGEMVLCQKCETWQHVFCYYTSIPVPDIHMCVECVPRTQDKKGEYQVTALSKDRHTPGNTGGPSVPSSPSPNAPRTISDPPNLLHPSHTERYRAIDNFLFQMGDNQDPPTDAEFHRISTYLRNTGQLPWSKVPRLYTVLRLIGELPLLDTFMNQGFSDIWFPFTESTLPSALAPSAVHKFLQTQGVVMSKALKFEKCSERRHKYFKQGEQLPFEVIGRLGSGAHGTVDKVMSTISYREFARKSFRKVKGVGRAEIQSFLTELQALKKISYRHCVELVQSYTDPKYFVLIMSPVADCDLRQYLTLACTLPDKLSLLRSFFGCLANALRYLHVTRIRHRDIKPQNILVKADCVFLTDFGIALDWEHLSRSTTTSDSGKTYIYAAPEVIRYERRNSSADIWSLGCVFLEMATVIKGTTVDSMRDFFKEHNCNHYFSTNISDAIPGWIEQLTKVGLLTDNVTLDWVQQMLQEKADTRPTAAALFEIITDEIKKKHVMFCGPCCAGVNESDVDEDDETLWEQETNQ